MAENRFDRRIALVTGSTGFIGTALLNRLRRDSEFHPRGATRASLPAADGVDFVTIGNISPDSDWSAALLRVDTVIHLAARVHVLRDTVADSLRAFRLANTAATEALARQAARSGVRRFVYISSIKVNGEETLQGHAFTEREHPAPVDPYGISKHEAELALSAIARETGMEIVIIRPPLVYGPGVKANFRTMMWWLLRGVPLPFGAVDNRRSLVGLDNLVDLIVTCMRHPNAANQTFLASDGLDLSTTELLRRLGRALGHPARLIPVPVAVIRAGFAILGKPDMAVRLAGSLQVDITSARQRLNWSPPLGVDESLRRAATAFLGERTSAVRGGSTREGARRSNGDPFA